MPPTYQYSSTLIVLQRQRRHADLRAMTAESFGAKSLALREAAAGRRLAAAREYLDRASRVAAQEAERLEYEAARLVRGTQTATATTSPGWW